MSITSFFKEISILLFSSIVFTSYAQTEGTPIKTIVKEVVEAIGGQENYDNTRFIQWDFGKRSLYWDKWTGDVRVESPQQDLIILLNINTLQGKVYKEGKSVKDPEKLKKLLVKGKNWWINDSYWLVMPWKLQDPGVILNYIGKEKEGNIHYHILQLTFDGVGVTPQNKYHVFVDQKDHLIKKWSFYKTVEDESPRFTGVWDNYQKAGDILLSYNRKGFGPKNVIVKQEYDKAIFKKQKY